MEFQKVNFSFSVLSTNYFIIEGHFLHKWLVRVTIIGFLWRKILYRRVIKIFWHYSKKYDSFSKGGSYYFPYTDDANSFNSTELPKVWINSLNIIVKLLIKACKLFQLLKIPMAWSFQQFQECSPF